MAKIPIILEAGRADGKLIKTNSIYDDNQEKFLSDKIEEIDNNHNTLNNTVNSLTNTVNSNELDIENKLETEKNRAIVAESNLRETINNITEVSGSATTANIVTVDTLPNSTASNVQQALDILYKNPTYAGIATPSTNPGTPDGPVFYIANGKGTYINFDGIEVTKNEVVILYFDTKWHEVATGIASYYKLIELESDVVDSLGGTITRDGTSANRSITIDGGFKVGDVVEIQLTDGAAIKRITMYQDTWGGKSVGIMESETYTYNVPNDFTSIVFYNDNYASGYTINLTITRKGDLESEMNNKLIELKGELSKTISINKNETDIKFDKLGSKILKTDSKLVNIQNMFVDKNNESLYITDINGNIIAEIGKEGITTTALLVKDENTIKNLLEILKEIQNNYSKDILPIEDDALYVTDKNYNIFLSIAKNEKGEYIFNYVGKGRESEVGNCLYGKNIYSLGDSLSVGGDWQKKLCELTGAKFDYNLNYQNLSYGGTATYSGLNSGRDRAKKLVEYSKKGNQVDYVFLENVNDMNKVGAEDISTEGLPLMLGDVISFTDTVLSNYTECITYFRENISSIVGSITPKVGSEVILYYSGEKTSTNIKVIGSPQKSGQITINVGGRSYGIQVTANMTIKEIVNKILEYSYEGYTDELASDGVSVTFTSLDASTSANVSFVDTDSTGIDVYLSVIGATSKVTLTYGSLLLTTESWLNSDNWTKNYGSESWSTETLARVYKGLIEYLQKELPTAKLIWIIPTNYSYDYVNGEKREDGSLNYEAANNNEYMIKFRKLCDFQKKMCAMYGIDCIDLRMISGISFVNAYPIFYPNNNVHPNLAGYERWGECISRVLTGI